MALIQKKNTSRILPQVSPVSLSLPELSSTQSSHDPPFKNQMQLESAPPTVPNQMTGQRTLFDFAYFKPQSTITDADPEVWDHIPEEIDTTKTL